MFQFPKKVNEVSGIIWHNNLIWSIQDSGNSNEIFGFSISGEMKEKVEVNDASNVDWEDITTDKNGQSVAVKRESTPNGKSPNNTLRDVADPDPVVFEPREHTQHSAANFQPVNPIPQIRSTPSEDDGFFAWPRSTEPLAPEPLAVLEPPKVMRLLLASYKDARGNLNMPGYVYVQVEPETWSVGEAANLRPQRVIPTKLREKANQENQAREQRQLGVSPIETTTGNGG